jgi:hypothetical protein
VPAELPVRHADRPPAGRLEDDVAFAVGLERSSMRVERVAVELRDEPVLRPVQVDLVALHDAVGDRLRQTVRAQQAAQPAFETRTRRRRGRQQLAQLPGGAGLELLEPHELAHQRLGERGVERVEGERLGEVQQRAEGRGDRDAPVDGHVLGPQVAAAVDHEAGTLPAVRADHVHRAAPRAGHGPQRRRALMAQRAAWAREQHDRHLATARTDRSVTHRVHPAVKGDEPADVDHVVDDLPGEASPQQLPASHHAVLRGRDRRSDLEWSNFSGYTGVNLLHPARIAPIAQPNNA